VLVGVALAVLALDIVSKAIVVRALANRPCATLSQPTPVHPVHVVGSVLELCLSRNPGAAFGIGTSLTIVFSVIAIAVIVVILRTSRRIRSTGWAITLGLLLGGATGNLTDRIFRYPGVFRGWVVDWIQLPHWPTFNLADSSIVCGAVLAVLLSMLGIGLDGRRTPHGAGGEAGSPVSQAGGEIGGENGGQVGGENGGQPGGEVGGEVGGQPGGEVGGQPGGQVGGQVGGQADRQPEHGGR
jgi:signal peptidase II